MDGPWLDHTRNRPQRSLQLRGAGRPTARNSHHARPSEQVHDEEGHEVADGTIDQ